MHSCFIGFCSTGLGHMTLKSLLAKAELLVFPNPFLYLDYSMLSESLEHKNLSRTDADYSYIICIICKH